MNTLHSAQTAPIPAAAYIGGSTTACILVVDDQLSNIQIVGSVLGKLGYEIIPATDGPSALKRLALRPPDLILLDLLMPEMDGYEVCRRLRENPLWSDIPVIFLSAADDKDFIVRALESGGVDYLIKPFNHAELVSRVRTQLALKSARDRLRQLAEDKDELLGILAHDLKGHLGGMLVSAQLLCEGVGDRVDARSRQLAENILHSSGQLLGYVKEFLANAAADHATVFKQARLNLGDAAAAAVRQHHESARRKHIEIGLDLGVEPPVVLADPIALGQVLDNLVSNALKFSPPGKRIQLSLRGDPTHVECTVQDEGPGFTDEDRKRMFRRYGRLSAKPTGGEPSTGLGLSIVRKLVDAMNGEIRCESRPGAGAAFTVRLPRPEA